MQLNPAWTAIIEGLAESRVFWAGFALAIYALLQIAFPAEVTPWAALVTGCGIPIARLLAAGN